MSLREYYPSDLVACCHEPRARAGYRIVKFTRYGSYIPVWFIFLIRLRGTLPAEIQTGRNMRSQRLKVLSALLQAGASSRLGGACLDPPEVLT
jgi:hypothetical protein